MVDGFHFCIKRRSCRRSYTGSSSDREVRPCTCGTKGPAAWQGGRGRWDDDDAFRITTPAISAGGAGNCVQPSIGSCPSPSRPARTNFRTPPTGCCACHACIRASSLLEHAGRRREAEGGDKVWREAGGGRLPLRCMLPVQCRVLRSAFFHRVSRPFAMRGHAHQNPAFYQGLVAIDFGQPIEFLHRESAACPETHRLESAKNPKNPHLIRLPGPLYSCLSPLNIGAKLPSQSLHASLCPASAAAAAR